MAMTGAQCEVQHTAALGVVCGTGTAPVDWLPAAAQRAPPHAEPLSRELRPRLLVCRPVAECIRTRQLAYVDEGRGIRVKRRQVAAEPGVHGQRDSKQDVVFGLVAGPEHGARLQRVDQ